MNRRTFLKGIVATTAGVLIPGYAANDDPARRVWALDRSMIPYWHESGSEIVRLPSSFKLEMNNTLPVDIVDRDESLGIPSYDRLASVLSLMFDDGTNERITLPDHRYQYVFTYDKDMVLNNYELLAYQPGSHGITIKVVDG